MSALVQSWTAEDYCDRTGRLLLPQHHDLIRASAITLDVASARGYWSATRRRELRDLGFGQRQQEVVREASRSAEPAAALVVPLWWTDAEPVLHQVRPDAPRRDGQGKAIKYETPRDAGSKLDVSPLMREALGDPTVPLLVTEGIRKVDAAASVGLACVGLLGVSNWRGRNSTGGITALGEWSDVHLKDRRVLIVFDSDVVSKGPVYLALLKLRSWLESRGARVEVVYLPSGPLGAKVGLDDYMAAGHDRDDLLALATTEIRHPDHVEPGAGSWEVEGYRMTPNGVWMPARDDGEKRLSNFACLIERKDFEEDGDHGREKDGAELLESQRYHLLVQQGERMVRHQVTAAAFHAMRWPPEVRGLDLVVAAGSAVRDNLRAAIEVVSVEFARKAGGETIPRRLVYTHTGWDRYEGRRVYLHAGGGIGENGPVDGVEVRLSPQYARLALPAPPDREALVAAIRASLSLLDLGPDLVMVPVLGAVYRSVLGPSDFALHLHGDSGRFKSELAALAQSHFGGPFDSRRLPLSWTSTGNSLEGLLHEAADALVVIDDFLPAGLPHSEREAMLRAAARVFRAQGNRAGRSRMRADTSLRAPKIPRGLALSTGEELPPGLSQVARCWVIEVGRGAITADRLTTAQQEAGLYARAMAGYVRWLASRKDGAAALRAGPQELRATYRAAHHRTSDIAGHLEAGWSRFLAFAVEAGALTEPERAELDGRVRVALLEGCRDQGQAQREADPVDRYISSLRSALAAGVCHVSGLDGEPPQDANSWGWHRRSGGDGLSWEPRGDRVGWLDHENLYLLPEPAYRAAANQHRDGLGVGLAALTKRLHDAGYLVTTSAEADGRLTVRKRIGTTRPHVLHFLPSFSPGTPGTPGTGAPAEAGSNSSSLENVPPPVPGSAVPTGDTGDAAPGTDRVPKNASPPVPGSAVPTGDTRGGASGASPSSTGPPDSPKTGPVPGVPGVPGENAERKSGGSANGEPDARDGWEWVEI